MFDINPAAHGHYLADLERAYAKCRNHGAPLQNRRLPMMWPAPAQALSVMRLLAAAFSRKALF